MEYSYERFLAELAVRVKALRKERGMSHRELTSMFDCHLGQLYRIENGETVTTQTLLKLSGAFRITLEELVQGLGQEPSKQKVLPL